MRGFVWGLLAAVMLAVAAPGAARAQDAALLQRIVDTCDGQAGFGQRFGQDAIEGKQDAAFINSVIVAPRPDWPGFGEFEVVRTPNSQRIHTVSAAIAYGSEAEALGAMGRLEVALKASGKWHDGRGKDDDPDQLAYLSPGATETTGQELSVFVIGPQLNAMCIERALKAAAVREVFGPVEPPKTRPMPPQPPQRVAIAEADCERPLARSGLPRELDAPIEEGLKFSRAVSRYNELLAAWKANQMVELGVWTKAESQRKHLALLKDPRFQTLSAASLNELGKLMDAMTQMGGKGSEVANCKVVVRMMGRLDRVSANALAQWKLIDELYATEARKKGVKLDDGPPLPLR